MTNKAGYRSFYSYGFLRLYRHPVIDGKIQPSTLIGSTADPKMDGYRMIQEEIEKRVASGEEVAL